MRSFRIKSQSDQIYSKVAQKIGQSIRKQIITENKYSSVKKVNLVDLLGKCKTENDPEKSFWDNSYQSKKNKWNLSQKKFTICEKQDIDQYKKYELEKFKQKLKSKLEQRQHFKDEQIQVNHSRVKEIRFYQNGSRQEKIQNFMYKKQSQTDLFKRTLEKKKMQARILKRQKFLELEFKKWHRQEEKLLKHKRKLMQREKLRTTLY